MKTAAAAAMRSSGVAGSDRVRVGAQAARADASPHHPAAQLHPADLQVGLEAAIGAHLGVAHVVSVLRSLAADLAFLCHDLTLQLGNGRGLYHRPCSWT